MRFNRVMEYRPYEFQKRFHAAGKDHPERMLMAANRVGKTYSAACETTYHLTGEYPPWWEGRRFDNPVFAWVGSISNEASREITQKQLVGGTGEELGTGTIPARLIFGKPTMKQAGVSNVIDMVKVRHASGGLSTLVFKTYDQTWRKWQGTAPDVVWLDEEPSKGERPTAEDYRIFTEAQTRILTSHGTLYVTFTPLHGVTTLVQHFHEGARGTYLQGATWDDAPHIGAEDKASLLARYPDYEREARSKGAPMLGEGRVFPISEDEIKFDPFDMNQFPWFARIVGIDFGLDHPFAASWLAHDRDADIVYLYDCWRVKGETPVYHAEALKTRGAWIPIAWPHDGMNREKTGGRQLHDSYRGHGCNMLPKSARYKEAGGWMRRHGEAGSNQPVEPMILDIYERMRTGRFKVASHLSPWFEEFRNFHRKEGKVVAVRDDLLKSTFYGLMMIRYATPRLVPRRQTQAMPIASTAM